MIVEEVLKAVLHLAQQSMVGFDLAVEIRDEPREEVVDLVRRVVRLAASQHLLLRGIKIGAFERHIASFEDQEGFSLQGSTLRFEGIFDCRFGSP